MKRTMPVRLLTRYIRDAQFRSLAGIYIGLTADILYAAFRAIVGLRYGSRWFLSMAVYYAVLGMLRAYLIFGMRRAAPLGGSERLYYEYSCYRRTGFMLLALNAAMGAMISLMVIANLRYNYPGYIIYLSALHAFYVHKRNSQPYQIPPLRHANSFRGKGCESCCGNDVHAGPANGAHSPLFTRY